MFKKILIVSALILGSVAVSAQEKLRVAVFDPSSSGTNVDDGTKIAVREIISSTFVNTGNYIIVERSLLTSIMKEQKFSNTDVVDESQATKLGKLAGANKVVISVISLVGGRNMLSIKIIDVQTATIEQQKTKVVSSNDLLDFVEVLTLETIGKEHQTKSVTTHTTSSSSGVSEQTNSTFTAFEALGFMVINNALGNGTWLEAKNMCAELNRGGFNDWYLPSRGELVMLLERKEIELKRNLKSFWYWSSTEIDTKKAYNVSKNGWASDEKKSSDSPNCLCFRKIK